MGPATTSVLLPPMGEGSRSRLSLGGVSVLPVLRPARGQRSTAVRLGRASLGATPPQQAT